MLKLENVKYYNIKQFAKKIGVSVSTLRNWDREKKLIAYRFPSNRLYYTSYHFKKLNIKKEVG